MNTLLKPLQVRERLLDLELPIFTPFQFEQIFHLSETKTKYFLESQIRQGLFTRLKKGLYRLATDYVSEWLIANKLYAPSYLSFETALSYWNLIPEVVYTVTSATTKPTRSFSVAGKMAFDYYCIKKQAYTGYSLIRDNNNSSFLMADKEKALTDYLYFESLGKKSPNDRMDFTGINTKYLFELAGLYQRPSLIKLIKKYVKSS